MSTSQPSAPLAWLAALTPLVVAVMGAWFNFVYQKKETEANAIAAQRLALEKEQRFLIDKATVVKSYFEYLANQADTNQQRAALAVLASLGYTDLVIRVVTTNPSPANVQALVAIAATDGKDAANGAIGALESLSRNTANAEVSAAAEQALTAAQSTQVSNEMTQQTAIVAAADKTLEEANAEVARLKQAGFNAEVIQKGNFYRTIVPIEAGKSHQEVLQNVKSRVRPSAYAVDLSKWCGGDREVACSRPAQ